MGSCQEEKTPSSAKIWQKIGHEASSLEKKKKKKNADSETHSNFWPKVNNQCNMPSK